MPVLQNAGVPVSDDEVKFVIETADGEGTPGTSCHGRVGGLAHPNCGHVHLKKTLPSSWYIIGLKQLAL